MIRELRGNQPENTRYRNRPTENSSPSKNASRYGDTMAFSPSKLNDESDVVIPKTKVEGSEIVKLTKAETFGNEASNNLKKTVTEGSMKFPSLNSGVANNKLKISTGGMMTKATNKTSQREDLMVSTYRASKASFLGTYQSDFFADIDADAKMLHRFRESQREKMAAGRNQKTSRAYYGFESPSKDIRQESSLTKFRFTGLRTQLEGFTGRSKETLVKAGTIDDLKNLTDMFREQNLKDLKQLENKTLQLDKDLNAIIERNEKKHKTVAQLEEAYERLMKQYNDESAAVVSDRFQSIAKIDHLEDNLVVLKSQESRMQMVIDICNANRNNNDEWLRQLNYYSDNLSKCVDSKAEELKATERASISMEEEKSKLMSRMKAADANSKMLMSALDQIQADNSVLQSHFMSTEKIIKSTLESTKKRLEERTDDRLKQLEEGGKERVASARNRALQRELAVWKSKIEKYALLFADGSSGEPWTEKPETKALVENLTEKKELEKQLMQLGFELKEKMMKNDELRRRIEVERLLQDL